MKRLRIPGVKFRINSSAIFTAVLSLSLLAAPLASHAQQPAKIYRIGYLGTAGPAPADRTAQSCPIKGDPYWQAMVEGLRERGYIQGQNLILECRFTEVQTERAPTLAAELVSLKVDLLVVSSTPNVRAAKQATSTLPIVMVGVVNPVGRGLVASLARPGGNLTGLTDDAGTQIVARSAQLLKAAAPAVSRMAVLGDASNSSSPAFITDLEEAASMLSVTMKIYSVEGPEKLDEAFAMMTKQVEAILIPPSPFNSAHAQRIVDLAAQRRLPAIYPGREHVEAGGLMSYGVHNDAGRRRRVGVYVDEIFKGAKPGDLAMERPTKFELVINLKTAKALGLTIPPSLLLQADEVIQ